MSLSQKLAARVDQIIDHNGDMPNPLIVEDAPHHLNVAVTLATPVGIACDGVEYRNLDHQAWSLDQLKGWAGRLADRLTYLMEPFTLHEADAESVEVRLRSQAPTVRNQRRGYYEITLAANGTLRLSRYHYDEAGRQRNAAPCQFTREVLERLADDLAASSTA